MNLNELKKQLNAIPEECGNFIVVKSEGIVECRMDKIVRVIYI